MITKEQAYKLQLLIESHVDARIDYEVDRTALWSRLEKADAAESALNVFIEELTNETE